MKFNSNIFSASLIGLGAVVFVVSSRSILENEEIDVPLNVLGINQSPYGEVFAMAMQGPIDNYWHAAESNGAHVCDAECDHEEASQQVVAVEESAAKESLAVSAKLRGFIEGMGTGLEERTNPKAASDAHKFHIRRGIEDKLRFAYNLDPSHYGNYNAYHFFLTQPSLGTRPELTPHAVKLAFETINYCLNQRHDPRQALTAAAAAGNILELMLNDRKFNPEAPKYTTEQMHKALNLMDQSLSVYAYIANDWSERELWSNLSERRILEVQERLYFVNKIRESHEQAIRKIEAGSFDTDPSQQTPTHDS
ncbi:MAG: hypothetical protein AB8D78_13145 [Akkermansiaceae bacterium]